VFNGCSDFCWNIPDRCTTGVPSRENQTGVLHAFCHTAEPAQTLCVRGDLLVQLKNSMITIHDQRRSRATLFGMRYPHRCGVSFSIPWRSEIDSDCRCRTLGCGAQEQRWACLPEGMYGVLHWRICHQSARCTSVAAGSGGTCSAGPRAGSGCPASCS